MTVTHPLVLHRTLLIIMITVNITFYTNNKPITDPQHVAYTVSFPKAHLSVAALRHLLPDKTTLTDDNFGEWAKTEGTKVGNSPEVQALLVLLTWHSFPGRVKENVEFCAMIIPNSSYLCKSVRLQRTLLSWRGSKVSLAFFHRISTEIVRSQDLLELLFTSIQKKIDEKKTVRGEDIVESAKHILSDHPLISAIKSISVQDEHLKYEITRAGLAKSMWVPHDKVCGVEHNQEMMKKELKRLQGKVDYISPGPDRKLRILWKDNSAPLIITAQHLDQLGWNSKVFLSTTGSPPVSSPSQPLSSALPQEKVQAFLAWEKQQGQQRNKRKSPAPLSQPPRDMHTSLIEKTGGRVTPDLTVDTTHLVCKARAMEWKTGSLRPSTRVVNADWVTDSVQNGVRKNEADYPPRFPSQQRVRPLPLDGEADNYCEGSHTDAPREHSSARLSNRNGEKRHAPTAEG